MINDEPINVLQNTHDGPDGDSAICKTTGKPYFVFDLADDDNNTHREFDHIINNESREARIKRYKANPNDMITDLLAASHYYQSLLWDGPIDIEHDDDMAEIDDAMSALRKLIEEVHRENI